MWCWMKGQINKQNKTKQNKTKQNKKKTMMKAWKQELRYNLQNEIYLPNIAMNLHCTFLMSSKLHNKVLLFIFHISLTSFFMNVPLLFSFFILFFIFIFIKILILPFTAKLPYGQLVMQQKCLWPRCLW